ncbi:hypothetical protein [Streptosporangium sp. NPDC000509]|uniref:hypothetical protein n=1 Tax=Streptosporangium sp. NPDC000509 TaxID=3366186 RepID=UPI003697AB60
MPEFKSVLAGLAISTALAGGVVAMGAATTVTSANAMTTAVTAGTFTTWGGGGCCRRDREFRRTHHRFRLTLNNDSCNRNRLHNKTRSDRLVPLKEHEHEHEHRPYPEPTAPPVAAS